jgi:dolichyl-phosphate beta-glucosyltransferase
MYRDPDQLISNKREPTLETNAPNPKQLASLSIIIPGYNEESRIGPTLDKVAEFMDDFVDDPELIFVDDGSTDGTIGVVEERGTRIPYLRVVALGKNQGKGAAVREGMLAAKGALILFSDADLSTPVSEVHLLHEALHEGVPIAIGSRGMSESRLEKRQAFYREMMGRTFNQIVRLLLTLPIRDTQCGFKLFRRREARLLFGALRTQGFAFDVELLYRARTAGFGIAEVPVTWRNDERSHVRPIRDSARMFREIMGIRKMVGKDQERGALLAPEHVETP